MIQNLYFWKRQQNKNMRRRSTVRARNIHRAKMQYKTRFKGGPGSVGADTISPARMSLNMFQAMIALMNSRKVMKQQGQRGA